MQVGLARGDDLLQAEKVVDLVKIDVEGFELDVLRGLHRTLEQHRPIVLAEALSSTIDATKGTTAVADLLAEPRVRAIRDALAAPVASEMGGRAADRCPWHASPCAAPDPRFEHRNYPMVVFLPKDDVRCCDRPPLHLGGRGIATEQLGRETLVVVVHAGDVESRGRLRRAPGPVRRPHRGEQGLVASANAAASSRTATTPPSPTVSGKPPERVATTGRPVDMASMATRQKASCQPSGMMRDGTSARSASSSAAATSGGRAGAGPLMYARTPSESASWFSDSSWGPSPTMRSRASRSGRRARNSASVLIARSCPFFSYSRPTQIMRSGAAQFAGRGRPANSRRSTPITTHSDRVRP